MRERQEGRESGCCVSPGAVQRAGWAGGLVDSCDDGWRAGGVLLVWLIYSIPRVGYSLWQHIYSSCPLTVTTLDMRRTPRVVPRRKGHRGAEAPAPGLRVRAGSRKGRHQRHQTGGGKAAWISGLQCCLQAAVSAVHGPGEAGHGHEQDEASAGHGDASC